MSTTISVYDVYIMYVNNIGYRVIKKHVHVDFSNWIMNFILLEHILKLLIFVVLLKECRFNFSN